LSYFQRLALGMFGVTLAVATAYVATAPRVVGARTGMLAPDEALGPPHIVGAVDAEHLSAGPIVAVSLHGAHAYLLQNHSWLRVSGENVDGPFGDESRGGRGWIASGAGIAVVDSAVYVLDRLNRSLHVFAHSGVWRRTIRLNGNKGVYDFLPERISVSSDGTIALSGYQNGSDAGWSIGLLDRDTLRLVLHRPSSVFDLLVPLVKRDGSIAVLISNDYEFVEITRSGTETRRFTRRNPPRFALRASERTEMQNYLDRNPASTRAGHHPPELIPAVAHAYVRPNGAFLVAVTAGEDDVLVEELDSGGRPLRTLLRHGVPLPVGFFDNGIVLLREEAQRTVVERYLLPEIDP
jgi:hypothetical protein